MLTPEALKERLDAFDRVALTHLPTPLEELPALSRRVGTLSLLVKRDDQTGLAFGGNKARKLELIMADALRQGADTVVTWAGVQSNWCRQTAAAAARLGLRCVLILVKKPGVPVCHDGNLLLDEILGADVRVVDAVPGRSFLELAPMADLVEPVVEEQRRAGRTPYLAPIGGSLTEGSMSAPLGALAYVRAFLELYLQAAERGVAVDAVVHATGSASTQAGLLVGAKLVAPATRIVGISVAADRKTVAGYVEAIAGQTLAALGVQGGVDAGDVIVLDEYLAEGYGVLNDPVRNAVSLMAREEGILLDPVYTGKAMAGLLDLAGRGFFREGESVVFLHTGGTPALFPYREGLLSGS
ncbi:MAG TPA: D-cysteine desulfhydrase family protein [Longimicrobiales bacterium]|nr:D-cysteine desulfhydrase family protein [Longimicrobiales bacterium]